MIVHRHIEFDSLEFRQLERVHPSVRIAFPLDDAAEKRTWRGRDLNAVCTQKHEQFSPAQIWRAWDQLQELIRVLREQSDRAYWERELTPPQTSSPVALANKTGRMEIGLIAPGTDVCGMLAETRAAQCRDAEAVLGLLTEAVSKVGSRPEQAARFEGV